MRFFFWAGGRGILKTGKDTYNVYLQRMTISKVLGDK